MYPRPIRAVLLLLAAGAAAAQTPIRPPAPVRPARPTPITIAKPTFTIAKPTLGYKARPKPRIRPYQPPFNPNVILLDPGHGGSDTGARLGTAGEEKDLNVAFADRLKTLLEAQQFTVLLTHASADDDPTPDQRAEAANRSRAVACLLLHATNAGHGVHLFTSALTAPFFTGDAPDDKAILAWDSAQAASLARSQQLANEISTALNELRIPLVVTRVSVAPIDSMTCAAVAIEVAPAGPGASVADESYQQNVAESVVAALGFWRDHAKDQIAAAQAAAQAANPPATAAPAPPVKPKVKPKPLTIPKESPLAPDAAPRKPAPIVRRPPPASNNPPNGGQR